MDIGADLRKAYEDGYADGQWELFDRIATAWFKVQCYFRRENGMAYSSISGRYMPFDKAINEFIARLVD